MNERWQNRLTRHCNAINLLLEDIRETHPHALLFLANDNLCVLESPPEINGASMESEKVLIYAILHADGGDW